MWEAARFRLQKEGKLKNHMSDVVSLIQEVMDEVVMKRDLIAYEMYLALNHDIKKASYKGLADWYREFLKTWDLTPHQKESAKELTVECTAELDNEDLVPSDDIVSLDLGDCATA